MTCTQFTVDGFCSRVATAVAENSDVLSGAVKSKAVSCPMVLKNWASDKSKERVGPSGSSEVGKNEYLLDCLALNTIRLSELDIHTLVFRDDFRR